MKKILYILVLSCLFLTACGPTGDSVPFNLKLDASRESEQVRENDNLVIWSDIGFGDEFIQEFEKANPGVRVEIQEKSLDTQLPEYMQVLTDKSPVDVFVMDSTFLGRFSTLKGFENLNAEPYGAGRFKEDIPEMLWENHISIKDGGLFALPVGVSPAVLYYRADLMMKYGFPAEPEALALYLKSEKNLFDLAEKMKSHGHSIILWDSFAIDLYIAKYGFLNDTYENAIPEEAFLKVLQFTETIIQNHYAANKDLWATEGQQAIRDDEVIMLTLGSWGEKYLPEFAPGQSGKWRATELPLGLSGWSSSTALAIPAHSEKKELAWKFIEFTMEKGMDFKHWPILPAYEPVRKEQWRIDQHNPYFGNQKTYALYDELQEKVGITRLTPFDDELYAEIYNIIFPGLEQKLDHKEIYKNYRLMLDEKYGEPIEILRSIDSDK